ncbi:MAG: hypothetical protein QXI09_01485 [Candidatus Aenigmatarchaeota archaeon]
MEDFWQKIIEICRDLGIKIEKIEDNTLYASSKLGKKILIKLDKNKTLSKKTDSDSKILIISPSVSLKINKEIIKKALNLEENIVFLNRKSLEKIYPIDLIKIINYIKENPNTYLKKISEDLNIHPEKVRRNLIKLSDFIEVKLFSDKNLPKLPKLISLKKDINLEEIKEISTKKIKIVSNKKKKKRIRYIKISKEEALPIILKFIEENPGTHLREISRKLKINPAIVYYCLKEVSEFIEVLTPTDVFSFELPNVPIQIKIKDGYDTEGIMRVIKIKKMLSNQEFKF